MGGEGGAPADCNGKERQETERKAEKVVADLGGEDRFEL